MEWIRPSGSFRRKAATLKSLASYLLERCEGEPLRLARLPVGRIRKELLSIHGIGPETADSILLYAARVPVFVADSYAKRIAVRHGILKVNPSYELTQSVFVQGLPMQEEVYNEYHALLVRVGKDYCRATDPLCEVCPLAQLLPAEETENE